MARKPPTRTSDSLRGSWAASIVGGRRLLCLMPLPEGLVFRLVQIFGKFGVACVARWDLPLGPVETVLRGDGT